MAFRLTLRLFFSCDDFRFKEIECIWNKKIVTDIRLLSSAAVTASFAEIKTAPVHGSLKQELCMHYQHGQSFFKRYIHTTQCSAPEKEKCLFFKYERKHIFEIFDSFLSTYIATFLANFRDQCCRGAIQWRHHRPTGLQYSRDYLPSK